MKQSLFLTSLKFWYPANINRSMLWAVCVFVCCSMLFSLPCYSQNWKKRSPEEKASYYTRMMANDLFLDDSVVMKIYQINIEVSKKFDSLYADKKNHDLRKGAALIYQFRNEAYKEVLTTKQYLMFEDIERERREKKQKEKEEAEKK